MKPDHSYNHLLRYFMEVKEEKEVSGSSVSQKTGSTCSRKSRVSSTDNRRTLRDVDLESKQIQIVKLHDGLNSVEKS
jgi:hypothetical protein